MPMSLRIAFLALPVVLFVSAGCSGAKTTTFRERGLLFRYPAEWFVTGFSRTVSPERLVVASYKVVRDQVEGDCAGSRALNAVPRKGAALLLIDYGATAGREFRPRPQHFRLRQFEHTDYECFGDTYMLRFVAAGHDLQAHLKFGRDANAATRKQVLLTLDSLDRAS